MRQRTIKLYRIEDDGRRLFAGSIRASSPADLGAALAAVSGDRRAWRLHRQVPRRRARSWSRASPGRVRYPCSLSVTRKPKSDAVAYLRTSSATNVGRDKDSDRRQRKAIEAFAKRAGIEIVSEYYDAAVSGADAIEGRPGFAALLEHIDSNGVRVVLVEDQARFARDLKVYVLGLVASPHWVVRLEC